MQKALTDIILDQTERALWEVKNVIDCVPDEYWDKCYCDMPLWKHVYHMLHSLDLWFINPRDSGFQEPAFHEKDLNNLDAVSGKRLARDEMENYFVRIKEKLVRYIQGLQDGDLPGMPDGCEYSRFTLILAQHRHLHTHMGIIMGFIIDDTGRWPRVVGLEGVIPQGSYNKYV